MFGNYKPCNVEYLYAFWQAIVSIALEELHKESFIWPDTNLNQTFWIERFILHALKRNKVKNVNFIVILLKGVKLHLKVQVQLNFEHTVLKSLWNSLRSVICL